MNSRERKSMQLCALLSALCWATPGAAQEVETEPGSLYAPLQLQLGTPAVHERDAYSGRLQIGGAYTDDSNHMFGQYNGLEDEGLTLIGDLQWQDFNRPEDYWQVSLADMGLATREGRITWGRPGRIGLTLAFDSQQQVRNDSGRTPFSGDYQQTLPQDWAGGIDTSDFASLASSLRGFDRKINRDEISLAFDARLAGNWRLSSHLSHQERTGDSDIGAGIYINAASADAVLLRAPVDYATTELDLGLAWEGTRLHLDGLVAYSDFDNDENLLTWQNPYASFGDGVSYPQGTGGLGLAPDNEQLSGRLTGHYLFSQTARLQFDGSYALTSQNQRFPDYTVNPALAAPEPLPRADLDGEVAASTLNGKLLLRPWKKLRAELYYKLRDRDYDVPRNGYQYVRGDGADQPGPAFRVFNTAHDLTSRTAGIEASYRLPLRSRLSAEYAYEEVERDNAAVDRTEEDRYRLEYRIQPWTGFSARVDLLFADRAADTYQWDQSFFALLDTGLINATPDSQRFNNHPDLFQHHLANRERLAGTLNLNYLPGDRWNLDLNLSWRYDDYDQSVLGLTESEWIGGHFNIYYAASERLSANVYAAYDRYDGNQRSRAFRGGQEKNAFEIFPPLPQASDPARDWELDAEDHTVTLGVNLVWQASEDVELELDYSFADTRAEQELRTQAGAGTFTTDLPDVDTLLHHVRAGGTWHVTRDVSLQVDYRYYNYESDDWAWENVQADTLDKVLTFGQDNPDEAIHYVGISAIYRWQ
ncbi:MAG: MtrB/PioB family decaheme-associated outer membrane protein [Halioglobus sp.]|nr:MtrB/PioB family decaheme-associated outer membrane protein [Halioglobus sp.]